MRDRTLAKEGIDLNAVYRAEMQQPTIDTEVINPFTPAKFAVAFSGVFIIYTLVLVFSNSVSTNVAKEKSNRTMELLLTNSTPRALILGKVTGGLAVLMIQMAIIIFSAVAGILVNQFLFGRGDIGSYLDVLTVGRFAVFAAFGVLGIWMFLFLYAGLASLVSRMEDVSVVIWPVMVLLIIGFTGTMTVLSSPQGTAMRVLSIIPVSSYMAMFARCVMTEVPWTDILLSLILLGLSVALSAGLSIRLYENGSLHYGNRMTLIKALKKVKRPNRRS